MTEPNTTNTTPRSWDDMFPGRFLKAGNLPGNPCTLAIESITMSAIDGKTKPVIRLAGIALDWVPSTTDGLALRAMFGDDPSKYIGRRITLCIRQVEDPGNRGSLKPAIRIAGSPEMQRETIEQETTRGAGPLSKKIRIKLTKTQEEKKQ